MQINEIFLLLLALLLVPPYGVVYERNRSCGSTFENSKSLSKCKYFIYVHIVKANKSKWANDSKTMHLLQLNKCSNIKKLKFSTIKLENLA